MSNEDKLSRICSKLIEKACEIRNGTIGSEYSELNTLRTMRAVMYEDLAQIIRSVAPEPRKPREWDVYEMSDCITSFEPTSHHAWKRIRVREVIE